MAPNVCHTLTLLTTVSPSPIKPSAGPNVVDEEQDEPPTEAGNLRQPGHHPQHRQLGRQKLFARFRRPTIPLLRSSIRATKSHTGYHLRHDS